MRTYVSRRSVVPRAAGRGHNPVVLEHDDRPWGSYTVLEDAPDHKVKRLEVLPGKRLSYQKHTKRSEHWFVLQGSGLVTLDGVDVAVQAGQAIDIPLGAAHRIANVSEELLVFIEVQHGESFDEDDIVRLEDDFGRVT